MNTKRLFFALWPDHRQRDRLRDVVGSVAKTVEGQVVDRRNWHVTLAFIGAFPENRIPYLLERAAEIKVEPFRLNFDRLEYWPRPRGREPQRAPCAGRIAGAGRLVERGDCSISGSSQRTGITARTSPWCATRGLCDRTT